MPLNLIKRYNELLDISGMSIHDRQTSLMGVFNRDFKDVNITFKDKLVTPTVKDGKIALDTLYSHLTSECIDNKTRKREFDIHRSKRLHWVKFHINEIKKDDILVFSVNEPEGNRTYIYDKTECYVIVLEPLRNVNQYYLLTAFHVRGRDAQRDKYLTKYNKRRLPEIL